MFWREVLRQRMEEENGTGTSDLKTVKNNNHLTDIPKHA
jgi:hypothetical protein